MTHTSGLACDDNDDASPGNEVTMGTQRDQPDWWKYTLDLPVAYDPGTHYAYCSGGMSLVGGALTAATGLWLPALFDRTVDETAITGRFVNPVPRRLASTWRAQREIGFQALVGFEDGLQSLVGWWRQLRSSTVAA